MTERSLACIIGWPVAHSLSPAIHNAAFAALDLPWTYMTLAVRPGAIAEGVGLLRTLQVRGANVTAPHKRSVIEHLDDVEQDALAAGAVNTITAVDGRFVGSNTDGPGFLAFLRSEGVRPEGSSAIVLGAGGAARGVALALARAGVSVTVWARDPAKAASMCALDPAITVAEPGARADLLVQATSSDDVGVPSRFVLDEQVVAVDLIYGRTTAFLRAARAARARTFDGLGMLIHQAALSFKGWTGVEAPLPVMEAAARGAA